MNYFFRTLSKASIIMVLLLSSCVSVPGTQDWKIKKAAMAYVRQGLKEDERMRWGSILRKGHMEIDGKMCTYAEIKYIVVSSRRKEYRTLNLLLSKNCDTVYSVLDEKL